MFNEKPPSGILRPQEAKMNVFGFTYTVKRNSRQTSKYTYEMHTFLGYTFWDTG